MADDGNDLPVFVKSQIDQVIDEDEGGWKLTHNANDPDGGWTYAGVTSNVWNEFQKDRYTKGGLQFIPDTYENMLTKIGQYSAATNDLIYYVYYTKYYKPLQDHTSWQILPGALFSCAVNCGLSVAVKIWDAAEKEHSPNAAFLQGWTQFYVHLAVENAKAWHTWASFTQSAARSGETITEADMINPLHPYPKVFRAGDLAGWLNRVERYRE